MSNDNIEPLTNFQTQETNQHSMTVIERHLLCYYSPAKETRSILI